MRLFPALVALLLAATAGAAKAPAAASAPAKQAAPGAEVPPAWHAAMQSQMQSGQQIVQTLTGDLDGDGKPEWIAIGEPTTRRDPHVSVAIFEPAKGKTPPKLRFSQWLEGQSLRRAGAAIRRVAPLGNVLVLVASNAARTGDSQFVAQIYGWNGKTFRPMVPEVIDFRSQGGFSIEDVDPSTKGDEIVAWTYLPGPDEQLFDLHRYAYKVYRWDGIRFVGPDHESRTPGKLANPEAAGTFVGAKKGDLRRQIPRIAEVP